MFETSLLSSPSIVRRGSLVLPLSLCAHAAVVLAIAAASLWRDEPLLEPSVSIVFIPDSPVPAPPPRGSENGSTVHQEAASTRPRTIPREVPHIIPDLPPSSSADDRGLDENSSLGPALGLPDGVDHGTGTVPGTTATSEGAGTRQEAPLIPGGKVTAPVLLHRVEPEYPELARSTHLEGVVILQAIISATGQVEELQVLKSPFALLDEAAARAVRQWRYQPSTLNGRAVRVFLTATVTFRIR